MQNRSCLAVILAAGDSTRMKSSMSKVLHPVAGRPIIAHVMDAVARTGVQDVALVLGRDAERVAKAAATPGLSIQSFLQTERLGTAHAVLTARAAIEVGFEDILIAFGDVPLITEAPFLAARAAIAEGHDIAVIGFETSAPTGYGRLLVKDGQLLAIREEKDASPEERKITLCNSGLMAINGRKALGFLKQIGNANAKSEYYLTDIVEVARAQGASVVIVQADEAELVGCNTRAELAAIEKIWQERRRHQLMLSGVSMIAPETVFLSHDTTIAADVTIEPFVRFGPGVTIGSGAVIHSFTDIQGTAIEAGASVGPIAKLRPRAKLKPRSKAANISSAKKAKAS